MKIQQMYNKHKTPISKDKQILNRICKECGRYRKIPQHFRSVLPDNAVFIKTQVPVHTYADNEIPF